MKIIYTSEVHVRSKIIFLIQGKRVNHFCTILFLILASFLSAQNKNFNVENNEYKWECIGPPGGRVFAIAINSQNPEIVFANSGGGLFQIGDALFKSTDGGITSELDTTFPFAGVPAISPLDPDLMFYTVYRTLNGGVSWDSMETGAWSYAFHPYDENIIYALNGYINSNPGKNLIVSYDKGLSWDTLHVFTEPVNSLQTTYVNENLLFVKSTYRLFRSTNAGSNWNVILTALPGDVFGPYAVAPNDSLIYLITSFDSQLGNPIKFYCSTNFGNIWEVDSLATLLQTSPTNAMVINPDNSDIIYLARGDWLKPIPGDILISTDTGNNWVQKNTGLPTLYNRYLYTLAINPLDPENLYVGSYGWGVFKTINGAKSWEWSNLTKAPVFSICIDDVNPDVIYACTIDEGVLKTTNKGAQWEPLNLNVPMTIQLPFFKMIFDPNKKNTAYIASWRGLFKSVDGGNNWVLTSLHGDFDHGVYEVSVHPNSSDTIYAGKIGWLNLKDLYRSTDEANTWSNLYLTNGEEGVIRVIFNPLNPDIIYIGALSKGIYKSTDRGVSWFSINNGLKQTDPPLYELINSLEISDTDPNILYSDNGGVVMSTNGGEEWFRIDSTLYELEENIKVSRVSYINGKLYLSSKDFLQGNNSLRYAGGLYVSSDDGLSWQQSGTFKISSTGPGEVKSNLGNPNEIFISTTAGIYKGIDSVTSVGMINNFPESPALLQNFPNPFNSSTNISFSLEKNRFVKIKIYNILGKEVTKIIRQIFNAGTHTVSWDGTNYNGESLPSGIYFYRLEAEDYFETKKMIILR